MVFHSPPWGWSGLALIVLGAVLLTGCATTSPPSLANVQQDLSSRSELVASWPKSDSDQSAAEKTITDLLSTDLSVDHAVQIALLNNRGLRVTMEEIGLSQADLIAASRLRNPTLAASVRWPDHAPRGPNVEFSLAADLVDSLLIPLRKRVAQEQLRQTEQRVAQEVLNLAAEVKAAVYAVEAQQQFRAQIASIFAVNDAAADLAQRQYDAGNINQLDLAGTQLAAQEAKLELNRSDAQLRREREQLNRLLGLSDSETHWKIAAELPGLPAADPDGEGLEDAALRQRLDIAAAKSAIGLAESALNLKRKTRLWPASVNVGVDTERDPSGGRVSGPRLELGLPIFDQGQADLARLSAEVRRATSRYENLASEIRSEVRAAQNDLLAARTSSEYYTKTLLPQRKFLLHQTLLHYNAMQRSSYELLAAKERQLATERESIEALRDYWTARTRLERATGGRLPGPDAMAAPTQEPAMEMPPEHHHPSSP
jgi:cobalt-zinc-cadmium efflux system outer membrane protein